VLRLLPFSFVVLVLLIAARAAGQDDVLTNARALATSGHRDEALSMLQAHLEESPRDVDARLLYGLVLSWEGRYDEARPALQQVLTQAPEYTDARVALMNVEYWSGRSAEAMTEADRILAKNPGNVTARAVRERLEAANRPWWANTSYTLDAFSDGSDPWQEFMIYLTRRTPVGSAILRISEAARFGLRDQMFEVDFYPRFRPGTYAYLNVGVSPNHELYPQTRFGFDLYQSLGKGFEASGGARYLNFAEQTQIYVGTLTKYLGNWMLTGKVYYVPSDVGQHSTSYHGGFRRYYGSDGTSYVGINYSHGFSREEIRSIQDLATLNSDTVRGEFDHLIGSRFRLFGSAAASHQERADRVPVWQTTLSAGASVQF
jgi:YaiO family outer membrane protein